MSLRRWEPFSEVMSLRQAMERLFEDSFVRPPSFGDWSHAPPLDVYQTDNDLVVKATLPGVKPEDVDITVTADTLTIKGETKSETEVKREHYLLQERRAGAFQRSITLPVPVKTDAAEATFEDGILTINIPKAEEVRPKAIKVKAKGIVEGKKA